jgi:threonylcarbamoyladenosine tRNA methylthiotransferase MtaB
MEKIALMKVAFFTLGCKVNQNDTSSLAALFQSKGYKAVPFEKGADIYVINTCSVTRTSDRKSAQIIRKAIGLNPGAVVVVTGCFAQMAAEEVSGISGVNLVVGMAERPRIVELVESFMATRQNVVAVYEGEGSNTPFWSLDTADATARTRATLKIEDGCEQFCSYCIVPYARGKVRSQPPNLVNGDFRRLLERGFKEIVLTGIHLGSYGKDLGVPLDRLLRDLIKIPGDFRIRLGSIEPYDLSDPLLDLITGSDKICQFLHIPLQSGCNRILELMNRGYGTSFYAGLISNIRTRNPLMGIGTDLIVGFPGETDTDFEVTRNFVLAQNFSRIHVFRFSPRPGTKAAALPERIPKEVQEARSQIIQQLSVGTAAVFARKFMGRTVRVLFEEQDHTVWTGLTGEYLRVRIGSELNLQNHLELVSVSKVSGNDLEGKLLLS